MPTKDYALGKGTFWFSPFTDGVNQIEQGFLPLGNVPEAGFTREVETYEHYSSEDSVRRKDLTVQIETRFSGSFTADEVKPSNLAYFIGGSASLVTNSSGTGVVTNIPEAHQGRMYQLGATPSNPLGLRNISSVVVTDTATPTPAIFTLNTDYTLDLASGLLLIVEGGGIANGTQLSVTFSNAAYTSHVVSSGTNQIEGAMRFISKNPVGRRDDWYIPWCILTPNGDFSLISEEAQTIPFTVEIQRKGNTSEVTIGGNPII